MFSRVPSTQEVRFSLGLPWCASLYLKSQWNFGKSKFASCTQKGLRSSSANRQKGVDINLRRSPKGVTKNENRNIGAPFDPKCDSRLLNLPTPVKLVQTVSNTLAPELRSQIPNIDKKRISSETQGMYQVDFRDCTSHKRVSHASLPIYWF